MMGKQTAAIWTVAITATAGLASSAFQYWTNQDADHAHASAEVSVVQDVRWLAHDVEHNRLTYRNRASDTSIQDLYRQTVQLRVDVAVILKGIELLSQGRRSEARKVLPELAGPQEPIDVPRTREPIPREQIAEMEINVQLEQIQKKAKELYKK